MDGFKAYQYYLALKLHFTTLKFNVFDNRGVVKGSREAFNARNDRGLFEKLSQKYDTDRELIQYFVANFAYGNDTVVYEPSLALSNLQEWTRRKQSITKIFVDDLATIMSYLDANSLEPSAAFDFHNGEYPVALMLFIGKKITIETMVILNEFQSTVEHWKQNSTVESIWSTELQLIKKLSGFIKYDKIKVTRVMEHFREESEANSGLLNSIVGNTANNIT